MFKKRSLFVVAPPSYPEMGRSPHQPASYPEGSRAAEGQTEGQSNGEWSLFCSEIVLRHLAAVEVHCVFEFDTPDIVQNHIN